MALPIIGIAMIWVYKNLLSASVSQGINGILIFLQGRIPSVPWLMTPSILISTLASHLFGASVGREGTAVQMGGGVSALLMKAIPFENHHRKTLMKCGVAAGFSALFGTPLAASVFAFEFSKRGEVNLKGGLWVLMASFLAYFVYEFWHLPHAHYHIEKTPTIEPEILFWAATSGLCFAVAFYVFHKVFSLVKQSITKFKINPYLAISSISVFVIFSSWLMNDYSFLGLGLPTIQKAFIEPAGFEVFLIKLFFTAICLAVGFKGGEVTPLFFIGATLGSAMSIFIPLPLSLL
ncbi:MAG: chloride channel protein, partial [Cytophagales bacterium]